jgi:hypothetical protein
MQAASMKSHQHPIGLAVEAPAALSIRQTAHGFVFSPADNARRRSTIEIVIEFRRGTAPAGIGQSVASKAER